LQAVKNISLSSHGIPLLCSSSHYIIGGQSFFFVTLAGQQATTKALTANYHHPNTRPNPLF
jgi:hypothetical protein